MRGKNVGPTGVGGFGMSMSMMNRIRIMMTSRCGGFGMMSMRNRTSSTRMLLTLSNVTNTNRTVYRSKKYILKKIPNPLLGEKKA